MAARLSTALRNGLLEAGGLKRLLSNCLIRIYTGSQPASANDAVSGTHLITYSLGGASPTLLTQGTGGVQLTSGAGGSVTSITVNGIEVLNTTIPYTASLTVTAGLIAQAINDNPQNWLIDAVHSSTVVTFKHRQGLGTLMNGWTVSTTLTTMGKIDFNMNSGANASNCLNWDDAAAGVIAKRASETWQGTALATGTAGWFRIYVSDLDTHAADSTESLIRLDGSVGTSGADLNMSSTSMTSGNTYSIDTFTITLPTS